MGNVSMGTKVRVLVTGMVACSLAFAGCSTKGGNSGEAKTGSGGLKTDFGITDDTITLGNLTDTSGVFKDIGLAISAGHEIWAKELNAAGGICGRQIKIETKDTGYAADKAVPLYAAMSGKVAAMIQIIGSPVVAALKDSLVSDKMVTIPATQAATNLDIPGMMMVGPTYDVEIINGLSYLQKQGLIKDGQKFGHIYIEGEYGTSGFNGSSYYAKKHNQTIVPVKIGSGDNDMSAAVTQLKSQNVDAVIMTSTGNQLSSAATQMAAQGMGALPLLGSNPTWSPKLVNTPAVPALGNYYRSVGIAPYGADVPLVTKINAAYEADFTEPPEDHVNTGYAFGLVLQAVLEQGCKDKDMTRAHLVDLSTKVKVDTEGITAPLDYSKSGKPSTTSTYIEMMDPAAPGGMKVVADLAAAPEAKDYKSPLQK